MNQNPTPRDAGYRPPAEWTRHGACITAWPTHSYAWGPHLAGAQREVAAFLRHIARAQDAELIELLCASDAAEQQARAALEPLGERVRYLRMDYGDIWLRDIGPLFVQRGSSGARMPSVATLCFGFNGWGGKFVYPHDDAVCAAVGRALCLPHYDFPAVIEGGAIELDGEGTCLTTESCLLNRNRNPARSRADLERVLGEALAVDKVLWLAEGLAGDHTDGHIDNLARFVSPATVMHALPTEADDPNRQVLRAIAESLSEMTDARGRALTLLPIPSPGRVEDRDGAPLAASYLNFYIGNGVVVVPAFGAEQDEAARRAIADAFPTREVVSASARAILEGGGTFHCMTRQRPELP